MGASGFSMMRLRMITLLTWPNALLRPMVKPMPTRRAPGAPRIDLLDSTRTDSLPVIVPCTRMISGPAWPAAVRSWSTFVTVVVGPPAPPVVPLPVAAKPNRPKFGFPPVCVKFATTFLLEFMTMVERVAVPARFPLQLENWKPAAALAVSVTTVPFRYVAWLGLRVTVPEPLTLTFSVNGPPVTGVKVAVTVLLAVMVIVVGLVLP